MNYIKRLREAYCLKQSDLAEFLSIKRNHISMIEIEKRRPTPYHMQRIECLLSFLDQAQMAPNEQLLKSLEEQTNAEVYRTLIKQGFALEEEINQLHETRMLLLEQHTLLKTRFLALQMLQHNVASLSWFTTERGEWLTIQLREAQKDFNKSKLSEIHLLDIRMKGLYTQLDHLRLLLQGS